MILKCYINNREYKIVQGATFAEEYNETLDSGTIIISHVEKIEDLKPYDDVFIYEGEFKGYGSKVVYEGFYKHLLVDQYNEEKINPLENIYNYTIQLFSETKKLETIQLPNVSITQPLNADLKISVYQYLNNYINLYSPVKKVAINDENWVYKPKYKLDQSLYEVFGNIYAPDFTLNSPSLKDIIAQLMLTRDKIPYVKDDVIYALDITERKKSFNLNGVISITGSMTSDDFCNNLKRNYSNALTQDFSCNMIEYLGFRNSNDSLLTLDNLRLETSFPIYKINKIYLCYYKKGNVYNINDLETPIEDGEHVFLCKQDITPLVKLNETRNLLSQDWLEFNETPPKTIEDLSKYKLATVGYDIGSKYITGWGTKYNYPIAEGFLQKETSYIQNILFWLDNNYPYGIFGENYVNNLLDSNHRFGNERSATFEILLEKILAPNDKNGDEITGPAKIKFLFFQVEYDAFYNGAIVHSKDNFLNDITINDNSSASLTLVDKDGLFQKEKINRFGNKAYIIKSRVNFIEELNNLGDIYDDDVIIYHREYQIWDDYILVDYYGTKDYVLKNYFTSVFAKYRNYNLMSYEESVNRAENKKAYLVLSTDNCFYEDNLDSFELKNFFNNDYIKQFLSFFVPSEKYEIKGLKKTPNKINYGYYTYGGDYFASDINTFTSGNSLCINMKMYDNVSGGVYIKDAKPSKVFQDIADDLIGSIQGWHFASDKATGHAQTLGFYCGHVDENLYFADSVLKIKDFVDKGVFEKLLNLPMLDSTNIDLIKLKNIIGKDYKFLKDNKERIDMTFQIEALTNNNDIMFSPWLFKLSDLLGIYDKIEKDYEISIKTPEKLYKLEIESSYFPNQEISGGQYGDSNLKRYSTTVITFTISEDDFDELIKEPNKEYFLKNFNIYLEKDNTVPTGNTRPIHEPRITKYIFKATKIKFSQDNDFEVIGDEFLTFTELNIAGLGTGNEQIFLNSNRTIKFKKVKSDDENNNFIFSNFETGGGTSLNAIPGNELYINISNKKFYVLNCVAGPKENAGNFTSFINGEAEIETETYEQNLFFTLSKNEMKKTIVYEELKSLDELESLKELKILDSSLIKLINDFETNIPILRVNCNKDIIEEYKNFNIWYKINNSYKFVFGVNLKEELMKEDKDGKYIPIYLSLISNRDTRIYDMNNKLVGKNFNYIELLNNNTEINYGDVQYFSKTSNGVINYETENLLFEEQDGTYKVLGFSPYYNKDIYVIIPKFHEDIEVTKIDNNAFENEEIVYFETKENIVEIGENAFYNCQKLKKIILNDEIEKIEKNAFGNCLKLNNIVLPENLTSIEESTFENCENLISITFFNNIKAIEKDAFNNSNKINFIYYNGNLEDWCEIQFGNEYSNPAHETSKLYLSNNKNEYEEISSIIIPNNINSLGDYQFYGIKNLINVVISNKVEKIGNYAFKNSRYLNIVAIPNSVTTIGYSAFHFESEQLVIYCEAESKPEGWDENWVFGFPNDENIIWRCDFYRYYNFEPISSDEVEITWFNEDRLGDKVLTIPDDYFGIKVASLGNEIFYYDENLQNAKLPYYLNTIGERCFEGSIINNLLINKRLKTIKKDAFRSCSLLKEIDYAGTLEDWCQIQFENEYSNPMINNSDVYQIKILINNVEIIDTIELPENLQKIENYLFVNFRFSNVLIPDGVKIIGEGAFKYCNALNQINIPDSIKTIESSAFEDCNSLTSIVIPNSVTSIGDNAFNGCSSLENIEIPISIKKIEDETFKLCVSLTNINIPKNIISIGNNAFDGCRSLENVYYAGTIENWCQIQFENEYSNPISYAENIYMLDEDGEYYKLINLEIPNNITNINNYQFYNFSIIQNLTIPNNIEFIGKATFKNCINLTNLTLNKNVNFISANAFEGCSNLKNVYFDGTIEDWCQIQFENEYSNPMNYAEHFYMLDENNEYYEVTEIVIPDTVTSIGDYQFYGFDNLISIEIPYSVLIIGEYAFGSCFNLTIYTQYALKPNSWNDNWNPDGRPVEWNVDGNLELEFILKEDNTYEVSGIGNCISQQVVIPKKYNDLFVTSIGEMAFNNYDILTNIIIPDSIVEIKEYAFYNCTNLTSIEIPHNVTSIGKSTFSGCNELIEIILPENLTILNKNIFYNCFNLESISIPKNIITISENAFYNCQKLTSVIFDDDSHLINFENDVFNSCYKLSQIILPNNLTTIGERVFNSCVSLTNIEIPDSVTGIADEAFKNCSNLTSIKISNNIINMGNAVFSGCSKLTIYCEASSKPDTWSDNWNPDNRLVIWKYKGNLDLEFTLKEDNTYEVSGIGNCVDSNIIIPNYFNDLLVTSIKNNVFENYSNLISITFGNNIINIGNKTFLGCNNLEKVYYNGTIEDWCNIKFNDTSSNPMNYADYFCMLNEQNEYYEVTEIVIPDTITSIGDYQFYGFDNVTSISIPNSVTSIGSHAFEYCSSLESIVIPNGVTSIQDFAFSECRGLTSIVIPDSITSIGSSVFWFCTSLTSIVIPDSVTSIGNNAFYSCGSLTSIEIPNSVTSIGNYTFYECNNLEKVYYNGTIEDWCNLEFISNYSNPMYYAEHFYMLDENNEYYEVTEIIIPDNINIIGNYQFAGFDNVTSVIIPNSITSIGDFAFYYCTNLTNIKIPNSVTNIGFMSFSWCTNLENLEIPSSVTSIDSLAFENCSNLTIYTEFKSKPDGWKYNWYVSDNLVIWGLNYNLEFSYNVENETVSVIGMGECVDTDIVIPFNYNGFPITSINYNVFSNKNLKSITITKNIVDIKDNAFGAQHNLEKIYYIGTIEDWCNINFESLSSNPSYANEAEFYLFKKKSWNLISKIVLSENITEIKNNTFANFKNLTEIDIPSSVSSIGNNAFSGCNNLSSIYISYIGLNDIGYTAFWGCKNLKYFDIPSTVTNISDGAFYGCNNLERIVIPINTTYLGKNIFEKCSKLTIYCEAESKPEGWNENWNIDNRTVVWGYKQ